MNNYLEIYDAPFTAQILDSALVDGIYQYAWQEQYVDPGTGLYYALPGGRNGSTSLGYATELNNLQVPNFLYRRMWFKSIVAGVPTFEFENDSAVEASSGGICIQTVSSVSCDPSGGLTVVYQYVTLPSGSTVSDTPCAGSE